jgi:outer membrane lipoprotein-sorting protein
MRTPTALCVHPTRRVPVSRTVKCFKYAFLLLPVAAHGAGLDDAFAAMDKIAQQFKAVATDIHRDVYTAVIDDHEKDMGTMKAKRVKSQDTMMLIELTNPVQKFIAVNGGEASVYTPKTKTVQVYDVKRGLVEQFLLLGFGAPSSDIKEHYDLTFVGAEKVGADMTWRLQLVPKSPDVLKNLKKAELWIGQTSGLPVQEKLFTSSSGDYELITYSNVKLNPSLSDKDLKLNPPKGVTVEHPKL